MALNEILKFTDNLPSIHDCVGKIYDNKEKGSVGFKVASVASIVGGIALIALGVGSIISSGGMGCILGIPAIALGVALVGAGVDSAKIADNLDKMLKDNDFNKGVSKGLNKAQRLGDDLCGTRTKEESNWEAMSKGTRVAGPIVKWILKSENEKN